VGAGMGDGKPHQGRPGTTRAGGREDRQSVALPEPSALVDRIQPDCPDWLAVLQRNHPNDVFTQVVLVDIGSGENPLFLDEDSMPNAIVHQTLFIGAGFSTHNLERPLVGRVDGFSDFRQDMRSVHGVSCRVGICRSV
jgi:hypothetical protein